METLKINTNNKMVLEEPILPVSMKESGNTLIITVNGRNNIREGDTIVFKRFVYAESNDENIENFVVRKKVTGVNFINDNTEIMMDAINRIPLDFSYISDKISGYSRLVFNNDTNIFAQDIVFASGATIQWYNTDTMKFEDVITDLQMEEVNFTTDQNKSYQVKSPRKPSEFLFNHWMDTDFNCSPEKILKNEPMYYYKPFKTNSNVIFGKLKSGVTEELLHEHVLCYKWNAFYFVKNNGTCVLFKDPSITENGTIRVTEKDGVELYNRITIAKETGYWRIPVGFETTQDFSHLYQEQNVNNAFTEEVKNLVVESAPVIDMEKVKYAPYYIDIESGKYKPLTSVTYNLHFRVRDLSKEGWNYIDNDSLYWNSNTTPSNLIQNNISDMLYYLGFTDNDVQNQKMKLKKSFIRLSFYDSKDPLTQKLLYYSTIFVDTGELFGKYIKAKNELAKNGQDTGNVVLSSSGLTNHRLDCHFTVCDEYFTEKSSDGFNIYYFPDIVLNAENVEETIYMKVEFNHAGYGRTIPMILWPKTPKVTPELVGNTAVLNLVEPKLDGTLSVKDVKEWLYVPIKLKYVQKENNINNEKVFVYLFDNINGNNIQTN